MKKDRTMSVMAPLWIDNDVEFALFEKHLHEAAEYGVEVVSVDVWWGKVMASRRYPDWSYYNRVFKLISTVKNKKEKYLKINPIIAFHQCGGGPGDDKDIPLPKWIYTELAAELGYASDDMKYESETGKLSRDYIPPWITTDQKVQKEMMFFLQEFVTQFSDYAKKEIFIEINISMGPTGELRYPSYNKCQNDFWKFPHRGYFQAYSKPARKAFQEWALKNKSDRDWLKNIEPSKILPPGGGVLPYSYCDPDCTDGNCKVQNRYRPQWPAPTRADHFIVKPYHYKKEYGQDFIEWYHRTLLGHCRMMLQESHKNLNGDFQKIPIGIKIPGIHWQLRQTDVPRIAEITAGLTTHYGDLKNGEKIAAVTGYESIFETVVEMQDKMNGRKIHVHFTALEMDDDEDNGKDSTSLAHSLVLAIGQTARRYDITLMGENAIGEVARDDGSDDGRLWKFIHAAFDGNYYDGFNLLRLAGESWECDKKQYKAFIEKYDL